MLGFDVSKRHADCKPPLLKYPLRWPAGDETEVEGALEEAIGLRTGELALVRPNGYIGAIVGSRILPISTNIAPCWN